MIRKLFWSGLFIGFVLNTGLFAQPELDATFGGSGFVNIQSTGGYARTRDIAIQPDNKIILVSPCSNMQFPFCAVRLNENGLVDNTFRGGNPANPNAPGVFTEFGPTIGGAVLGVAVQGDGKVVAVGYRTGEDVAMARYNSDGSLDTTFGSGGKVETDITPGSNDHAEKVVIQADGKIVIVGYTGSWQFVGRYLPDGTLDNSFGVGGIVKTVSGQGTEGRSIALQPDGKIVAGGDIWGDFLLTRFNPDGSPDMTWDGDGIKSIPSGAVSTDTMGFAGRGIRSVAIQSDGKVVALGHNNRLFRFNPDGSPDTGFDEDGEQRVFTFDKETYSMTISPGGLITVGGSTIAIGGHGSPSAPFFRIARFKPDGTPDTTFSGDGYLDVSVGGSSAALAVSTDPIGRVVLGGVKGQGPSTVPWEFPLFSAVRLLGPPVAVSISGRVTDANGVAVSGATVKTDLGGGTMITARTNPFGYYILPGVMTGQTYTVSVSSKGHRFTSQSVFVGNQFVNVDFIGQ